MPYPYHPWNLDQVYALAHPVCFSASGHLGPGPGEVLGMNLQCYQKRRRAVTTTGERWLAMLFVIGSHAAQGEAEGLWSEHRDSYSGAFLMSPRLEAQKEEVLIVWMDMDGRCSRS